MNWLHRRRQSRIREFLHSLGRKRSITKLEVAIIGMVNRAVKGDPKAMQQMLALAPLVGLEAPSDVALPEADAAVVQNVVRRLLKKEPTS